VNSDATWIDGQRKEKEVSPSKVRKDCYPHVGGFCLIIGAALAVDTMGIVSDPAGSSQLHQLVPLNPVPEVMNQSTSSTTDPRFPLQRPESTMGAWGLH